MGAAVGLTLKWLTSSHLEITLVRPARIDFQAIKAFGELEISVRDLSGTAGTS
jgi:hypothetical protein